MQRVKHCLLKALPYLLHSWIFNAKVIKVRLNPIEVSSTRKWIPSDLRYFQLSKSFSLSLLSYWLGKSSSIKYFFFAKSKKLLWHIFVYFFCFRVIKNTWHLYDPPCDILVTIFFLITAFLRLGNVKWQSKKLSFTKA